MRRLLLPIACVLAVSLALGGSAGAGSAALSCGVPEAQPVWIDFADGSVAFWRDRFARPGVVVATGGPGLAADARAAGAATVHWDMHLRRRVGTPPVPADPQLIEQRADSLFENAVSVTGCARPLIALNELSGASAPTPLTEAIERYRANVLHFVSRLAERGGRPALLVAGKPFTGGDAASWWRSVGQVSDLVLESYPNANVVWRQGPIDGSRQLRTRYRRRASGLLAVGVPPSRIGLMIGFQTGLGTGGREGLKPRSRWFEVAKLQAFAARQVAREFKLAHIWSWGWAMRNERSNDPDKTFAACVWLWARDEGLCDAPGLLGREFDPDRRAGQIELPSGIRCVYGEKALTAAGVAALARVTGDRELALSAMIARAIERERTHVPVRETLAAERRIVAARFGGSRTAYRSALAQAGASVSVARGIIGDELRRREILSRRSTTRPSSADVGRFRATYAQVLARRVSVSPAPSWLPEGRGVVLATSAPPAVFQIRAGRTVVVATAEGRFEVRALGRPTALAAVQLALARPAIFRELVAERRAEAYAAWTLQKQKGAESRLVCERDRLPEVGVVTLSSFVPFLALDEGEAARWAASRVP